MDFIFSNSQLPVTGLYMSSDDVNIFVKETFADGC